MTTDQIVKAEANLTLLKQREQTLQGQIDAADIVSEMDIEAGIYDSIATQSIRNMMLAIKGTIATLEKRLAQLRQPQPE